MIETLLKEPATGARSPSHHGGEGPSGGVELNDRAVVPRRDV